jgi:probable F420-dependent oxidoreductase
MKIDVGLGVEGDIHEVGRTAQAAEELGFDGFWTSETKHDSFLPLAMAASDTEKMHLGNSVAIAFSRSPMVTAQLAWDMQSLSGGRFILGLGTQVRAHIERRFSMPFDKPASRLADYIRALRAIWVAFQGDGKLDYRGEFYQHTLLSPFFNPGPIQSPEIPVYIAGVNTRLAKLAGELCDGFHVHPFHSPEYVRNTVQPAIAEGAGEAGRSPESVELATSAFVISGTAEETKKQREAVRQQISFYASTPTYRTVLEAHGWEEVSDKLSGMAREKRWSEMPREITDEMVSAFAVEAAPDELGAALKDRYEGLINRVALYTPFEPGKNDEFWRAVLNGR